MEISLKCLQMRQGRMEATPWKKRCLSSLRGIEKRGNNEW
jgi:hypothetical protein